MAGRKTLSQGRRVKGAGSLNRDAKRGWYGQITRTINGKKVRRSTAYFDNEREARIALQRLLDADIEQSRSRDTVRGVVTAYIECEKREATTEQRYRGLSKNMDTIASVPVDRLADHQIDGLYRLLRDEGLSGTTIFHVHSLLNAAFKWAKRARIISTNPFETYSGPIPRRNKTEARALRVEDAQRFMTELEHTKYGPALLFCLATGMRRGEVCGLRWDAIDMKRCIATVRASRFQVVGKVGMKAPKPGVSREVALSLPAQRALAQERSRQQKLRAIAGSAWSPTGFVFVEDDGSPIAPLALTNAFRVVAKHAGFGREFSLHSLRHTAATWALASGMEMHAVQGLLGHLDVTTTMRIYGHVLEGRVRAAFDKVGDIIRSIEDDDLAAS